MTCYIVSFQTNSDDTRARVKEILKTYGSYCPIHDYCWAIKTDEKATQIRDKISKALNPQERLFVIRSGTEAAWYNSYGEKHNAWLKENL